MAIDRRQLNQCSEFGVWRNEHRLPEVITTRNIRVVLITLKESDLTPTGAITTASIVAAGAKVLNEAVGQDEHVLCAWQASAHSWLSRTDMPTHVLQHTRHARAHDLLQLPKRCAMRALNLSPSTYEHDASRIVSSLACAFSDSLSTQPSRLRHNFSAQHAQKERGRRASIEALRY
eukprot:1539822-Pleurochrysis_carterae.AAC.3